MNFDYAAKEQANIVWMVLEIESKQKFGRIHSIM
ncbi:hypothetical protein LYSIN_00689 [Lysinibacillus sphaericus]|uniref:Uncharacterized protein n=1 Tax=Lysinibacillus sphaericus TaxID=1421 RepID=A0A2S5CYP6_LYSSH|nr:hypothetical protein LYSIN_00689 [Lysinibacillus sphaericus]